MTSSMYRIANTILNNKVSQMTLILTLNGLQANRQIAIWQNSHFSTIHPSLSNFNLFITTKLFSNAQMNHKKIKITQKFNKKLN